MDYAYLDKLIDYKGFSNPNTPTPNIFKWEVSYLLIVAPIHMYCQL